MRNLFPYSSALICCLCLSFVSITTFGQTGPAGVGSSTNNRIWLDAHSLSFTDGSPVGAWTDLSGNGVNFFQGASARQPIYHTSGISGLPTITFDGVNDVLSCGTVSALESTNLTYFIVYDKTTLTTDMLINARYASNPDKWRTYTNSGTNLIISAQYSPAINWVRFSDPPGASFLSSHITPTNIRTFSQGSLIMSKNATYTTPTGHQNITLGNKSTVGTGAYIYTGHISEVIIYNTALTNLQRIMVENYLGAKYQMPIATDRFAYEVTHRFGLIGLGNDGTTSQTVARGAGILELSGATSLGTNEYLLVAHTDFSPSEYNLIDLPVSLPAHQRLERTWRVGETGEVGTTTLRFHLGGGDFAVPDSYRLLVDNDGTFTDATIIAGTYDEVTSTVSFNVNLNDGQFFTLSGILEVLFIHSITDGLWGNPSTWDCDCIPGPNDFVFIDPGTNVTVNINGFTDLLRIELGGTLTMNSEVTLDINGDWEILGTTNFTNGTISLTGEAAQDITIISPGALTVGLHNLLINNTSDENVSFINRTFVLSGLISPIRGNIVIDPSTRFVIASTSGTNGGRVGPIIAPTNFTGNFVVQRNIPAGVADWRDLASPVIGSTFNDWDPDLAMSGPDFPDGCAFGPDGCFKSVTFTDHDVFNEVLSSSTPILNTRGYEIFVGTDLVSFSGTTLNSTGTLNTSSDIIKPVGSGWTTIGNPYASPIAFSSLIRTGPVGNYFYVYDPASGAYEWYDGASGTTSIPVITEDGLIAIGQAIWVFAASSGSITYTQLNKVENIATFIRSHDTDNSLQLVLNESTSTYNCSVRIEELEEAIDGIDEVIDIRHLEMPSQKAPSLALKVDNENLRKNYVKADGRDKSFELYTKFLNEGYYSFSLENWGNFRNYNKILLFDSETGETVNLKENSYAFYALATDEEVEIASRFTLILTNSETISEDEVAFAGIDEVSIGLTIKQFGHLIDIQLVQASNDLSTITLTNVLGQNIAFEIKTNLVNGSNMINLPSELKGFYILSVQTGDQVVTKKLML